MINLRWGRRRRLPRLRPGADVLGEPVAERALVHPLGRRLLHPHPRHLPRQQPRHLGRGAQEGALEPEEHIHPQSRNLRHL